MMISVNMPIYSFILDQNPVNIHITEILWDYTYLLTLHIYYNICNIQEHFYQAFSGNLTRLRTHLWPDAECIHRQRQK